MTTTDTATPALPTAHEAATAAFADPPSATPEPTTDSTPSPAAAIAQPSSPTVDPGSAETPVAEPPKWRWQDILEHTRKKTAEEAETRVRQEWAWANDIAPEDRALAPQALKFARWLDRDPVAATEWLTQQVQSQPSTSVAQRPGPDVDAGNGIHLYSDAQMERLRAWDRQQILAQVRQEMKPFEEDRRTRLDTESKAAMRQHAEQTLNRLQQRPHFKEHQADIRAAMLADPTISVEDAYAQVLTERVIPALGKQQEAAVLAHLQTRAVAGTLNPSSATPTSPKSMVGNARAAAEAAWRDV